MEEGQDQCFRVYDASEFFILCVSQREDLHAHNYQYAGEHRSKEEARRIAKAISRLPHLLRRPPYLTDPEQRGSAFVFLSSRQEQAVDNLSNRVQPDRSKINMHEAHEVKYWTHQLGVTRDQLQKVVGKVGNSAAAVRKELAA